MIIYGIPNLINHGCHWYDVALHLAGDLEPQWVSGFVEDTSTEPPDSRRRLDPTGRCTVGLQGGVHLYFTPGGSRQPAFDVIGDQGRLTIMDDGRQAWQWQDSDAPPQPLAIPHLLATSPPARPSSATSSTPSPAAANRLRCRRSPPRHRNRLRRPPVPRPPGRAHRPARHRPRAAYSFVSVGK